MNGAIAAQALAEAYQVTLPEARPQDLGGAALWFPLLAELAEFDGGKAYLVHSLLAALCLDFFNRHLRGLTSADH
jgi:hypothetical protein